MDGRGRVARVKCLSNTQKELLVKMNSPTEMSSAERKRQLAAMGRYMESHKDTMPPGLMEKWKDSYGNGAKKFELLPLG